jgi:hypothetical protein
MAFLSGAVCGALMVSLYTARQNPPLAFSSGSPPAFHGLKIAPNPQQQHVEEVVRRAEATLEERPVFVPNAETRRQRRLLENSPRAALEKAEKP